MPIRNKVTLSEHELQVQVVTWAMVQARASKPELSLLYAVPNGGARDRVVAIKMKAEGLKPGVSDLVLPVARGGRHGLYMEMKTPTGRLSDAQKWWRERLTAERYLYTVQRTFEGATRALTDYLAGREVRDGL